MLPAHDWPVDARTPLGRRLQRRRSRAHAKSLWIQAVGLLDSGNRTARTDGRDLLRRLIADHPGEVLDLSWAHALLGDACERDGLDEEAERHYRRCDELERDPNGPYSGCDLRLAELILRTEQDELYDEADDALDRLERAEATRLTGAGHRYRHAVARARLLSRLSRDAEAASYAVAALCLSFSVRTPTATYLSTPGRGDAEVATELHDLIDAARG